MEDCELYVIDKINKCIITIKNNELELDIILIVMVSIFVTILILISIFMCSVIMLLFENESYIHIVCIITISSLIIIECALICYYGYTTIKVNKLKKEKIVLEKIKINIVRDSKDKDKVNDLISSTCRAKEE